MARKSKVVKEQKKFKYRVKMRRRCQLCGRPRGYIRFFGLCRLCFRSLAREGKLPGVRKASW